MIDIEINVYSTNISMPGIRSVWMSRSLLVKVPNPLALPQASEAGNLSRSLPASKSSERQRQGRTGQQEGSFRNSCDVLNSDL